MDVVVWIISDERLAVVVDIIVSGISDIPESPDISDAQLKQNRTAPIVSARTEKLNTLSSYL